MVTDVINDAFDTFDDNKIGLKSMKKVVESKRLNGALNKVFNFNRFFIHVNKMLNSYLKTEWLLVKINKFIVSKKK